MNDTEPVQTSKIPIIVISNTQNSTRFCIVPQFIYEDPKGLQERIIYARRVCDSYFLVEFSDVQIFLAKKFEAIKTMSPELKNEDFSPLAIIEAFATYLRRILDGKYEVIIEFFDIEGDRNARRD